VTAADRTRRELLWQEYLSRYSTTGFCADCLNAGVLCPDHRQDPAPDTEATS
jgi:hypothetical protein